MTTLANRIAQLERQRTAKAKPIYRFVIIGTEDDSWSVTDQDGMRQGFGPLPIELEPSDYVIRSNVSAVDGL